MMIAEQAMMPIHRPMLLSSPVLGEVPTLKSSSWVTPVVKSTCTL